MQALPQAVVLICISSKASLSFWVMLASVATRATLMTGHGWSLVPTFLSSQIYSCTVCVIMDPCGPTVPSRIPLILGYMTSGPLAST